VIIVFCLSDTDSRQAGVKAKALLVRMDFRPLQHSKKFLAVESACIVRQDSVKTGDLEVLT
jgi:hypothetical protein